MRSGFGPNLVRQELLWSPSAIRTSSSGAGTAHSGGLLPVEAAGIEPAPGGAKTPTKSRPYLVTARSAWASLSRRVPSRPPPCCSPFRRPTRHGRNMAGEVKTDHSDREGKYAIALRVVLVIQADG